MTELVKRLREKMAFFRHDGEARWLMSTQPDLDCAEAASALEELQDFDVREWVKSAAENESGLFDDKINAVVMTFEQAKNVEYSLSNAHDLLSAATQRVEQAERESSERLKALLEAQERVRELEATIEGASESEQWHQEILDLFARNGSGDYSPTPAEVEIINDGVTRVLRVVRAEAAKHWFKRYLGVLGRCEQLSMHLDQMIASSAASEDGGT